MPIQLKTPEQIELMRVAGTKLATILRALATAAAPGVSTMDLEMLARELAAAEGVDLPCIGYHGYPAGICTSLNDEVVHCIPSTKRILQDGDVLKLDIVTRWQGWCADACRTIAIGQVEPETQDFLDTVHEALYFGINQARAGNRIGDIGHAIQQHVESAGFSPVRETVGHGIGQTFHEDPEVPNYGRPGSGPELRPGMTICIEPIITAGHHRILTAANGWDTRTADGSLAAHFEHTVLITDGEPEILTPWDDAATRLLATAKSVS